MGVAAELPLRTGYLLRLRMALWDLTGPAVTVVTAARRVLVRSNLLPHLTPLAMVATVVPAE